MHVHEDPSGWLLLAAVVLIIVGAWWSFPR
jgi:hypothetical protein